MKEVRTRSDRVSRLHLPPGQWAQAIAFFRQPEVLSRLGMCALAALAMWCTTTGWSTPFPYRLGQIPDRAIISRATFERKDEVQTQEARQQARRNALVVYRHNPNELVELRQALKDKVDQILRAESYGDVNDLWREFMVPPPAGGNPATKATGAFSEEDAWEAFRTGVLAYGSAEQDVEALTGLDERVARAFRDIESTGLLKSLQHELNEGRQTRITVLREDGERRGIDVNRVRITSVQGNLKSELEDELDSPQVTEHVYAYLAPRLPETLRKDDAESLAAAEAAAAAVEEATVTYEANRSQLAESGVPLTGEDLELLRLEHQAVAGQTSWWRRMIRGWSALGMFAALYVLCGVYLFFRRLDLLEDFRRFALLQTLVVSTVTVSRLLAPWQLEMVPLLLFGMTAAIAYRQEVALLLAAVVSLVAVLSLGLGLVEFVTWTATLAATILLLTHVRTRTKLIYVGLCAGGVAGLTTLGVGMVVGQHLGTTLLVTAGWHAGLAAISGILMTGTLPFIERLFDVQTEISLLELGDVAHPLLQELVRRAPGTYNHSINVASLAESAAESIGANGLLVRVGAYFHDIGKMLKPQYFIENQGGDANRHEALLPAMSTLIIIAHVKDGADLARKHHLPQSLIDLILQHHGTTLVEYFYSQASKRCEQDPESGEVDEGSYRYPGPKPQTREAAVLMVADAVESASRTLTEPAPSRIEGLVRQIAMKKLLDGQFDECGLTLQELHTIERSLVKSLTGIHHSRIKYPDQQRA